MKNKTENKRTSPQKKSTGASSGKRNGGKKGVRQESIIRRRAIMVLLGIIIAAVVFFAIRVSLLFFGGAAEDPNDPYPVKGVDVSSYQMEIDWKGLEDEGVEFAFIKATEGTTLVDNRFEYNWKEAHKTGMKVGAYHFISFTSSAESQAQNFIDTVDKKWGMLPPVVDVEFFGESLKKNPTRKELRAVLDVILDMFEEEYNRTPIIYTNRSIYKKYISGYYDEYPIWIASPDYIPEELSDGRQWLFCQYTFTGRSPSIADGTVDVDYNVFYGSKREFRRYKGK